MTVKEQIAQMRAQLDALEQAEAAQAAAPDPYADALNAVTVLAKANTELPEELSFDDEGEEVIDADFAKGVGPDDDDDTVDALPLLNVLLRANNRQARGVAAVGHETLASRRDLGTLAKAVGILMGDFKEFRTELRDFLDRGRGSASRQVAREALAKSVVPAGAQRSDTAGLEGRDILAKATFAGLRDPRLLTSGEIARIEAYVNGDPEFSLSALREGRYGDPDPGLALRVEQAIAATSAAA